MGVVLVLDHGNDANSPNDCADSEHSTGGVSSDQIGPWSLCDKITDVEDGSSRAELLALETHGLLHTENLGVVQSGLVKVLKSLG